MSLRVAVQMDPLDRINVSGDSTFAIMIKAAMATYRPAARADDVEVWIRR